MAWIEKTGLNTWRVRWRRADGTTGSITGFRSEKTAAHYADDLECDQRRGTWLDPSGFRTTVAEWVQRWLPSLDLDTRHPLRLARPHASTHPARQPRPPPNHPT